MEERAKGLNQVYGRHRIVRELTKNGKFSLDVGCSDIMFGNVAINLSKSYAKIALSPTILADVRHLPFKNAAFERVYFLDVIEHLPIKDEHTALLEIRRVLDGELIMTMPNKRFLYVLLDPAFYLYRHKHFSKSDIERVLRNTGFKIEKIFTMGGIYHAFVVLLRPLFKYLLQKKVPLSLIRLCDKEYQKPRLNGYTIFFVAHTPRNI